MKITLEQTSQMVDVNGVTCRVWEGETEKGIKISALIPRIAVATTQNTSRSLRRNSRRRNSRSSLSRTSFRRAIREISDARLPTRR